MVQAERACKLIGRGVTTVRAADRAEIPAAHDFGADLSRQIDLDTGIDRVELVLVMPMKNSTAGSSSRCWVACAEW